MFVTIWSFISGVSGLDDLNAEAVQDYITKNGSVMSRCSIDKYGIEINFGIRLMLHWCTLYVFCCSIRFTISTIQLQLVTKKSCFSSHSTVWNQIQPLIAFVSQRINTMELFCSSIYKKNDFLWFRLFSTIGKQFFQVLALYFIDLFLLSIYLKTNKSSFI